jgi:hypothetical protein
LEVKKFVLWIFRPAIQIHRVFSMGNIEPAPGKTLRETTKKLVETLKADAIKHQGYAFRDLMEKYVNDPHGLEHLRNYKEQFERDTKLPDKHNAHYRVRTNFAVMYAAAALAIDYEILPWKTAPTFRAIEKCMRLALAALATGAKELPATLSAVDAHHVGRTLKELIAKAELVVVKPKQQRLQGEWEVVQASRDRNAIYQYLASVFELSPGGSTIKRKSSTLIGRRTCNPPSKVQPFDGTSTEMDNHKTPAHFDPRRTITCRQNRKTKLVNMPGGQLHSEKENKKC